MLRVIPRAEITARMPITTIMMVISPCSLLKLKNHAKKAAKKIKGKQNHDQILCHQIQRIRPPQEIQSSKVLLLTASDSKYNLNLRHKCEHPGEMADYSNPQYKCYIPEKDVE